jgi:DNA uptake protein ComE-like DNA-binding protein
MKTFLFTIFAVILLGAIGFTQQDQQSNPPLGDQSTYPSSTHKMNSAEKRDTPEAHGQPVDLNSGTKKDIAALPGVGPDRAQNIIDARPFNSKDDLLRKKLLPQSTFDQIKDKVTVEGPKKQSQPENHR